jgi:hypothetical protein
MSDHPDPAQSELSMDLLHEPIPSDDKPGRRWAYPAWAMVLISAFIAYHATVLMVHNLPGKGLSKDLHTFFNKTFQMGDYMRATGNTQSWAMFAPNPHRSNIFMRVVVQDKDGVLHDLEHDIYDRRSYPYLFYDRMGKVNRRIVDQKGYRRHYAAWVCREWERTHGGEPADEVQFTKLWTRIPHPRQLGAEPVLPVRLFQPSTWSTWKPVRMGFDPVDDLHLNEREEDTVRCRTTRNAQLPNYLRERYGLPELPEGKFLPVHLRTWWDKREAEERKQRREAQHSRAPQRRPPPPRSEAAK